MSGTMPSPLMNDISTGIDSERNCQDFYTFVMASAGTFFGAALVLGARLRIPNRLCAEQGDECFEPMNWSAAQPKCQAGPQDKANKVRVQSLRHEHNCSGRWFNGPETGQAP